MAATSDRARLSPTSTSVFSGFSRDKTHRALHSARMRRFIPLLLLGMTAIAAFIFVPDAGWSSLVRHYDQLHGWVAGHPAAAHALFVATYSLATVLSLPHAALMTIAGGLLFGTLVGFILAVLGATLGASLLLLIVRQAFDATTLHDRIPDRVRTRLARDGFLYLLALRFTPVLPFWVVNLAAAAVGMRLSVFVPATLIGIAPVSFILSWSGARISVVLAQGGTPDFAALFTPRFLLPLLALSAASLAPIWLRRHPGVHA